MAADLYQRAIARAAEILGGRQRLASYLQTDATRLAKWGRRGARPPLEVILAITQVVHWEWFGNYTRIPRRVLARRHPLRASASRELSARRRK
jgi:hypothetical protein